MPTFFPALLPIRNRVVFRSVPMITLAELGQPEQQFDLVRLASGLPSIADFYCISANNGFGAIFDRSAPQRKQLRCWWEICL
jgi:hypothetical protein